MQAGDVITNIGDVAIASDPDWGATFRTRYRGKAGQPFTITVQRSGQTLKLNTVVREHTVATFRLQRAPSPTPKQTKIWQGLASGL